MPPSLSSPVLVLDRPLVRHKAARRGGLQEDRLGLGIVPELPLEVRHGGLAGLAAVGCRVGAAVARGKAGLVGGEAGVEESIVLLRL